MNDDHRNVNLMMLKPCFCAMNQHGSGQTAETSSLPYTFLSAKAERLAHDKTGNRSRPSLFDQIGCQRIDSLHRAYLSLGLGIPNFSGDSLPAPAS